MIALLHKVEIYTSAKYLPDIWCVRRLEIMKIKGDRHIKDIENAGDDLKSKWEHQKLTHEPKETLPYDIIYPFSNWNHLRQVE